MNIKTKSLVFVMSVFYFISSVISSNALAQDNSLIRVSGFSRSRSTEPLISNSGGPYINFSFLPTGSDQLGAKLLNVTHFGENGVVPCSINYHVPTNYVSTGYLVDENNNLKYEIFFASTTNQDLTDEEVTELSKFVKLGGILYMAGDESPVDEGLPYNKLLENLGIGDSFDEIENVIDGDNLTAAPTSTYSTSGPFGQVGPLWHSIFRKINISEMKGVFQNPDTGSYFLAEARVGKGYIVLIGEPLHINFYVGKTPEIARYYENLFAMGCDKSWQDNSVVLEVPSYKQIDPAWADDIYDNALNNSPLCGETMADCACALTSATMVMKYFGVDRAPDASNINPQTINNYFKADSVGFSGPNFRWSYLGNFSADANEALLGEQPKLEQPVRDDYDLETIKVLIDNGKPVILRVNSGTHWVVIKGYDPDTNRLIINDPVRPDPLFGEYIYLDQFYTPDLDSSMVLYETTNSDYRYFEFATDSKNHLLVTDSQGNKTGFNPETGEIMKNIQNSDYVLDPYYVSPIAEGAAPTTDGVYFLTLKLPEDGNFKLKIISQDGNTHPVHVYSSDTEGNLAGKIINPEDNEESYTFVYTEETAGSEINAAKDINEVEAQIDVEPLIKNNVIVPHKLFSVPVAVLASDTFDVTKVNRNSLRFGKTGNEESLISCAARLIDLNRDKKKDLLCYFSGDKTELDTSDTEAFLRGVYDINKQFLSRDNVKVIKPWFLF